MSGQNMYIKNAFLIDCQVLFKGSDICVPHHFFEPVHVCAIAKHHDGECPADFMWGNLELEFAR
jgi:hypothetical protein